MGSMKILHILNELRYSGMEMMLINSSLEWKNYNVDIVILSTGAHFGEAAESMNKIGYGLNHISFANNKLRSFFTLRKYLKRNKFDVIHIHTEVNFFIHVLNCWFSGNKCIVRTFHSIFKPSSIKGRLRRHIDRKVVKLFNVKYISVGDSVARNELQNYGTQSETIYNWYDNNLFFPKNEKEKEDLRSKFDIKEDTFLIVTVGNCSSIKRHNLILEGLAMLPSNINWLFIHAGKEELGFPERNLAINLGINDNCRFLGSISNVEEILSISDLFIMSTKVEGLGNSVLEAMAIGVPIILTKVPGLIDLLSLVEGPLGVDSNPENIKESILKIYFLNASERKELSRKIAVQAKNKFSKELGVKKYYNYYQSILLSN